MKIEKRQIAALSRQRGLTLVELMIALVLSLLLMGGAIQLFVGSKQTFQTGDALARLQENGRFAMELLTREVRQAGYSGCARNAGVVNVINNGETYWPLHFAQPLQGFDGSTSLPSGWFDGSGSHVEDSDVVTVLYGDSAEAGHISAHAPDSYTITLSTLSVMPDFDDGDLLVATDCLRSTIFVKTGGTLPTINHALGGSVTLPSGTSSGNCTNYLGQTVTTGCASGAGEKYTYGGGTGNVMKVRSVAYYVAENASGEPSLYRRVFEDGSTIQEELVEGVEDMQILYGVDTDTVVTAAGYGSANKFIPANQVTATEWPNVVAVRVDLALRSLTDDVNPSSSTYTYGNGTSVSDKRIRQQYSTTIALRNRAP